MNTNATEKTPGTLKDIRIIWPDGNGRGQVSARCHPQSSVTSFGDEQGEDKVLRCDECGNIVARAKGNTLVLDNAFFASR